MNKILVSLGYSATIALPDDVESGAVIAALSRAQVVTSHGYGKDEKWTVADDSTFSVRKIDASKIVDDEDGKDKIRADELQASLDAVRRMHTDLQKNYDELKKLQQEPATA